MPKLYTHQVSRRRDTDEDFRLCLAKFEELYKPGDVIVSGGCPKGGDKFAEIIARSKGITIIIHHANWSKGRFAGFERNTDIAKDCTVLIAVVAADRTGGTEDTVTKALRLNKTVHLV